MDLTRIACQCLLWQDDNCDGSRKNVRLRSAIAMQSLFARAFACQGGRTPNNDLNLEDFLLIEGTADLFICGSGQVKFAEDIVRAMPKFGSLPDVVSYNSLIDGYCRNGDVGNASLVFERLRRVSDGLFICRPDVVSFNSLFNGFGKKKMLVEVFVYMGVMFKCCSPNVVTYSTWIDAFCKSGELELGLKSFRFMKRDGLAPNVVTFTCLIDGYCKSGVGLEVAVSLYEEMRRAGMSINVVTYSALIDGFCKQGEMQRGEDLYLQMRDDGLEPNSLVYTAFIDGYFKNGDADNAMKFLAKMLNQGMKLDIAAYGVIVSGLCGNGKVKEAAEVVDDMEKGGLVPDEMILTTMMNGYFKSGRVKDAVKVYGEFITRGFEPDVVALTALIDGLAKSGRLHEAVAYFCKERANDVMYTVVIDALCKEGDFIEVERLFEAGLVADKFMYTCWIAGLCKQGNLVGAFKLKTKMVQEGLELDLLTYTTLINGLASKGLVVEARQVFDEMLRREIRPDSAVFDLLIRAYEKEGDITAASELFLDMQTRGLVTVFPFFCSDREYIIGRRIWDAGRVFYCVTKGVQYPSVPRQSKPRRVDLYYSSWCIRAVESKRGNGEMTSCEVLLFHHEDMGIPWEIAKLGVRQGMWGAVKKIEPGLRAYQRAKAAGAGLSPSAIMAQINTKVSVEEFMNERDSTGEVAGDEKPSSGKNIPKMLVVGGAIALACTLDKGLLTKAVIFGVARRFARMGKRM
ncbi:hypothetical protein F2Q70_00002376 [Brassica cretica]|uniref:START domain-containing protein n=1 Tax=Brassica cretica TaxID=69181 RepID=A0A8S9IKK0_BRACR|nr:hypothetical protein F2Q70_00002376 [Brassica cretica]